VKEPTAELIAKVDGKTVVASTASPGALWVRLIKTTDERFGANVPAFIDPTGDDDNDGLTEPTAIASLDEWTRRMDDNLLPTGTTIVTCGVGACGAIGTAVGGMTLRADGSKLQFLGAAPTQSISGTITAVVTAAAAIGNESSFTAVGGPVLVDGQRLKIIASGTPSHVGAVTYIKGFVGGDVTKPITKEWMAVTSTDPLVNGTEITPTDGDTFVVETLLSVISGLDLKWEGQGVVVGFPYAQDIDFVNPAALARWHFVTNEKPSEANGHFLLQQCTFNGQSDFTESDLWFRNVDIKSDVYLSQRAFYGLDSTIIRGRVTCDSLGLGITNSVCIDSAGGIGLSLGPSTILIAGAPSSNLCVSRSNGNGMQIFGGAEAILGDMVCWAPTLGARNGLTYGCKVEPNGFGSIAAGAFQLNFFRGSVANILIADVAQNIPLWDQMHSCGIVFGTGFEGGMTFWRDTGAASIPGNSGTFGCRTYGQAGGLHGRGLGGSIRTSLAAGSNTTFGHASLDGVREAGGPVNTVDAATVGIVNFNWNAPGMCGSLTPVPSMGIMLKAYLIGIETTTFEIVSFEISQSARMVAGIPSLRGAGVTVVVPPEGDAALLGVTALFALLGTVFQLQVTGVAGKTIAWNGVLVVRSTDFVG